MAVDYDFYETPVPGEASKKHKRYHARMVSKGIFTTDMIAEDICRQSSFHISDVKGMLTALSQTLSDKLMMGYRVHLEDIGYFNMTLKCPPVRAVNEIRAESIRFKSISFQTEKKLKDRFKQTRFQRVSTKHHSESHSTDEIDKKLEEYFKTHEYFVRSTIESMFGFTRITAIRHINTLVKEGKIVKRGLTKSPFYLAAPGWYGKEMAVGEGVKEG